MKVVALNFLISAVVIVTGFALTGDLHHPSRDTLEAMFWLSVVAGGFMSLKDLGQSWADEPAKPEQRNEDELL